MRISRHVAFMETAEIFAKRSTCARLNVGCVVVANRRIISVGYNGHKPGAEHCTGNDCPGMVPGNCGTIHAEVNALTRIPASLLGFMIDVYVTDAPCLNCAKFMSPRCYVRRVFYRRPYRLTEGIDYLLQNAVEVFQITPAGYILNHSTREITYAEPPRS